MSGVGLEEARRTRVVYVEGGRAYAKLGGRKEGLQSSRWKEGGRTLR